MIALVKLEADSPLQCSCHVTFHIGKINCQFVKKVARDAIVAHIFFISLLSCLTEKLIFSIFYLGIFLIFLIEW